jgi:hypothetical protein
MPKLYKIGVPMFIIAYIASGFFTVRWDQAGIVKRFGRPINIDVQPGIHYKLPWPLSTVDLINIKKVKERTQYVSGITIDRLYIESMEKILNQANKHILDTGRAKRINIRLLQRDKK